MCRKVVYQVEQLDKLGMEVVPVELRDAYAFGGGLHCCTADVYREGTLKDYCKTIINLDFFKKLVYFNTSSNFSSSISL